MTYNNFTKVVHAGVRNLIQYRGDYDSIFQTSTYVQSGSHGVHKVGIILVPETRLEMLWKESFAAPRGAKYGLPFSSRSCCGAGDHSNIEPGDEVIVCDDVYGGTGRLFAHFSLSTT